MLHITWMFQAQYKLSAMNSTCGIMLIYTKKDLLFSPISFFLQISGLQWGIYKESEKGKFINPKILFL